MSTAVVARRSSAGTGATGAGMTGARFTPTRAGIINLWDYRDEEFVFADGWLVLRGPNGSGKTKALEVLFPFILDGRIEPRRLNPFAGEDRTMKSNLLYRGQDSALSYVWLEFARPNDDGSAEYVTVGAGLRAQRHSDRVTRWYFVTDGRVGVDFSLLDAEDRPVVRKHLAAQLGAAAVRDRADEHRAAVDARLFGLGPERYEQLLTLVLTLRRPQLARDLDPVRLSDTLTEGLRPISDDLLAEAARSFDDLEAVQHTLDGLVAADDATRAFLAVYTTYLRTHARSAADALTRRRDTVATQRSTLALAEQSHVDAVAARDEAREVLGSAEREPGRLRSRLAVLKASEEYRSAERIGELEVNAAQLQAAAERTRRALAASQGSLARRTAELAASQARLDEADQAASRHARDLAAEAERAGIAWTAADASPDGFVERLTARVAGRLDDVAAVRDAAQRLDLAARERDRTARELAGARVAAEEARAAERAADEAVEQNRAAVRDALRSWAERYRPVLDALDLRALPDDLTGAVAAAGSVDAEDPRLIFGRTSAQPVQAQRDEHAALLTKAAAVAAERDAVVAERDAIAAERDDAPTAWWARPADRTTRPGAPLWRLVRFADGLPEAQAAAIEAALEAANLLDAWVDPDDAASARNLADGVADGLLVPAPAADRPTGPTLATVLVAEDQSYVDASRVRAILESIAVLDAIPLPTAGRRSAATPWPDRTSVSTAGRFAQGVQVGAFTKPAAEFIGATARARRRAARIAECERRIAEYETALAGLHERATAITDLLDGVRSAERDLPGVTVIIEAVRRHDRAATLLRTAREREDAATTAHDAAVAEAGTAELALRRTCAERSLPASAVEETADAVRRAERAGDRLVAARREVTSARDGVADARQRLDEARGQVGEASEADAEARRQHAEMAEQLRTLRETMGADAAAVVAEVARTEQAIGAAERDVKAAHELVEAAVERLAAARTAEDAARTALVAAVGEEQEQARTLAPFAQPDLLALLRCPTDLRWPAQISDWPAPSPDATLPEPVAALHEAILAATRDLAPTETSIKQSVTRVTKAFEELQAQLSATDQEHRPEWSPEGGILVVKVADEQGFAPIKVFADRIARERHDQELLLSETEKRVMEDSLLASLARQIHQRTIDARDLVRAMDEQMRTRRMSSGVSVGVGWLAADGIDEDQRAVVKLLERDPARLGPGDLARLRQHFAGRIKAARAVSSEQSYRELLARVLDYRRWWRFGFRLHRPDGKTDELTKQRHSQLSGGEQAVSLHLPLFAAAHALFTSAKPTCPRLLSLDEAFAGIDDTGRAELMGLAVQFDLDLLMTGYDLWATYAVVPACAHYDLSHAPLDHTVSALLLVWDGAQSLADFDGSLAAALGSPGTRTRPDGEPATAGLFGDSSRADTD